MDSSASSPAETILPPELIHELRGKSSARLARMASAPGKHGFGRRLWERIPLVIAEKKTLLEKAIAVTYLCSYLADHLVLAEMEACRRLEQRDLSTAEQSACWEQRYSAAVRRALRLVPESEQIFNQMLMLQQYTKLPASLYGQRSRHWGRLNRFLNRGLALGAPAEPAAYLCARMERILNGTRGVRAKARSLCLTASLLADIRAWEQELHWSGAYGRVMIDLYPMLQSRPDVLSAVTRLA